MRTRETCENQSRLSSFCVLAGDTSSLVKDQSYRVQLSLGLWNKSPCFTQRKCKTGAAGVNADDSTVLRWPNISPTNRHIIRHGRHHPDACRRSVGRMIQLIYVFFVFLCVGVFRVSSLSNVIMPVLRTVFQNRRIQSLQVRVDFNRRTTPFLKALIDFKWDL